MNSTTEFQPTLFLSSSVDDAMVSVELRKLLMGDGIRVFSSEDRPGRVPWERIVADNMRRADVAVFVISSRPSPWMEAEIRAAVDQKVRLIVPVLLGSESHLPESLHQQFISDVHRIPDRSKPRGIPVEAGVPREVDRRKSGASDAG